MSEKSARGVFGVVERVADAGQSLSFVAKLVGAIEGVSLTVGSLDGKFYIDCVSLRAFVRFAREEHSQFPALSRTLSSAGSTAVVRVDGRGVAVLGAGVSPGLIAGPMGYGKTRLLAWGMLVTLVKTPGRWRRRGGLERRRATISARTHRTTRRLREWVRRKDPRR